MTAPKNFADLPALADYLRAELESKNFIPPCVRMKVLCPWRDLCDDGASPNRGRLATGGAPVRSPQGDWTADPRRARREALGT